MYPEISAFISNIEVWYLIGIIVLYFLPTTLTIMRWHPYTASTIVLNVFLGWTFVGWVFALMLAVAPKETPRCDS